MQIERFRALVARLEAEAAAQPRFYKFRVLAFALLGYSYLATVMFILVAILFGLGSAVMSGAGMYFFAKGGWALLLVVFAIVRAMWVRFPPPSGLVLTSENAPILRQRVEEIRSQMGSPPPHEVMLSIDYNASVLERPRFGIFGLYRRYLVLGLPLMHALSPDEFRAVLAHEFGHLSGEHGRFGAWIYRQRATWVALMAQLQHDQSWGQALFRGFVNWYVPRFDAYSLVLTREQEYEADHAAAALTSPRTMGDALTRMQIMHGHLEEPFWSELQHRAREEASPPEAFLSEFSARARVGVDSSDAQTTLDQALQQKTAEFDTHPALAARLAALSAEPRIPPPLVQSAAEEHLGPQLKSLQAILEAEWVRHVTPAWHQEFTQAEEDRGALASVEEVRNAGEKLTVDQAWTRATLLSREKDSADQAEEALRELLVDYPSHTLALEALGLIELQRSQDVGLERLERAIELDPTITLRVCANVQALLSAAGRTDEIRPWEQRLERYHEIEQLADAERRPFRPSDPVESHGLSDEELAHVRAAIATVPAITECRLVRRTLEHLPEFPQFVAAPTIRWGAFRMRKRGRVAVLLDQALAPVLESYVVPWDGFPWRHRNRFRTAAGEPIYRKSVPGP